MRTTVVLLTMLLTGCAVGYAGHGKVLVVAVGDASVMTCERTFVEGASPLLPVEDVEVVESPPCTVVHGGSMSQAFAALLGGLVGLAVAP